MIRIAALNDSSDDDESQSVSLSRTTTKEAQESAALTLYNRALDLLKRGDEDGAKDTFLQLLEAPFVKYAEPASDNELLVDPGLVLKYSSYKNLGSMAAQREEYKTAMTYYLEAVMVDSRDVTVWYKIGTIALKLHNYPLARHGFEQGLVCQPRHWPCLDNVITVLYALLNYDACLVYIARALERDPGYIKGISFMEKILEEQPSLRRHMGHHFTSCDQSIFTNEVDQDEADEYIEEAFAMRKKKQELCQPKERPTVKFREPLTAFTWSNLGNRLISLYDHIASSGPPITYSCRVDLSGCVTLPKEPEPAVASTEEPVVPAEPADATPPCPVTDTPTPSTTTSTVTTTSVAAATVSSSDSDPVAPKPATEEPLAAVVAGSGGEATDNGESEKDKELSVEMVDVENAVPDCSKLDTSLTEATREKENARRGPKRKRFMADSEKRRSARVRNTGSKPAEDQFRIQDLLVILLPTSLTQVRIEDEGTESSQEEAMDMASLENSTQQASQDSSGQGGEDRGSGLAELKETQEADVLAFIEKFQINSGIIELLNEYLMRLAEKVQCVWPDGLTLIYIKCYTRLHKHIQFPGYLCKDASHERIRNMAKMNLVHAELKVDRWMATKTRASPPRRSAGSGQGLGPNFPGPFFHSDLTYLEGVSQCQDIFDEEWANFIIRVFWMSAKFRMVEGKTAESISDYECAAAYVEYAEKESEKKFLLTLPHIHHEKEVALEKLTQQVELLRRCQSQDKMQGLHDSGEYDQVIKLLLETFENPETNKVMDNEERHAQLLLLVESLLKMKDYRRCVVWGEVSLNEALQNFNSACSNQSRDEWANTATQLMDGMDKAITVDQSVIRGLTSKCLVRFTQNLLSVIEAAFDVHESAHEMGVPTMLPWIIIYKLIYFEECQQAEAGDEESFHVDHSGSLSLLETAHEQLGRRSWCCNCDGALLLFIVSEVVKQVKQNEEMEGGNAGRGDFDHILEQCFFCLYGHPNRRRAKHLQDHSSSQISLTWDRSIPVFMYFKPQTMPEYDSLKTSTVSGELEALLRRIYIMIPTDYKLPLTVEQITAYIEGTANEAPDIPEGQETQMRIVGELYYLLADYYFKNKEQGKAIKFYLQDLCVNPERFDSWAGMALARASRLEQKLSLSELKAENKTEGSIWKHAIASLRCFQRALQLDNTNSKLWIEYGSLAYQLHAHASRQLKQLRGEGLLDKQVMYPLSGPSLEEATSNRTEMLTIAGNCYRKAGECEADDHEEEWLHHYMLGKVAEKKGEPPRQYLEHYKQALHFLHEDRARYPRKITYIYSPPHLAVETLEVFYRLHVSIIKFLMRHTENIPYSLFEDYIKEAAEGPFATCKEKEKKAKERDSSIDESSNSNMLSPVTSSGMSLVPGYAASTSTPLNKAGKHHSTRMDHTYSRQRSLDSSRSDAENSNEVETSLGRRMVTNQRTGVAISASDSMDSMQSPVALVTSALNESNRMDTTASSQTYSPAGLNKTAESRSTEAETTSEVEESKAAASPGEKPKAKSSDVQAASSVSEPSGSDSKVDPPARPSSNGDQVTSSSETERKEKAVELPDTTGDEPMNVSNSNDEAVPAASEGNKALIHSTTHSEPPPLPHVQETAAKEAEPEVASSAQTSSPSQAAVPEVKPATDQQVEPGVSDKEIAGKNQNTDSSVTPGPQAKNDEDCVSIDSLKGLEEFEKGIKKESLFSNLPIVDLSEGSSQDSTTVAELEKLKSEISFLNAGSSDLQSSSVFSNTYGDDDNDDIVIKVEKEDKAAEASPAAEAHEESIKEESKEKEEEDNSQNQALEALKSELQMLSAASGSFVVPDYIGTGVKTEPGVVGSQGFDVSEFGLTDSQESLSDATATEPKQSEPPKKSSAESVKEQGNDDLTNLAILESPLLKIESGATAENYEKGEKSSTEPSKVSQEKKDIQSEQPPSEPLESTVKSSDVKDDGRVAAGTSIEKPDNIQIKDSEPASKTCALKETSNNKDSVAAEEQVDKKEKSQEPAEEKTDENKSVTDENAKNQNNVEEPMDVTASKDKDSQGKADETSKEVTTGSKSEEPSEKAKADDKTDKTDVEKDNERINAIMAQCMKALELCLSRFPHHYKSLYRMAYIYYHSKEFKNSKFARDMLLGNLNWSQLAHMSSPGLFQERKSTNFFQGLWRIPIEEIDRTGSFACHMLRSIQLLFPILQDLKDHTTLYSIHTMLSKNPDAGKKYLRDSDRVELSRLALVYTIDILEELIPQKAQEKNREVKINYLLDLYRIWQYGVKAHKHSHTLNKLMRKAYFSLMKDQIEDEPSVLEQAIRFCQKEQDLVIKSPTTPDARSVPGAISSGSLHPLAGVSVNLQGDGSPGTPDLSQRTMKGITPISGTTRIGSPGFHKPLSKVLKPCSVRLSTPPKSKLYGTAGLSKPGQVSKTTTEGLVKKLAASNVFKKQEAKMAASSPTASSSATTQKSPKVSAATTTASSSPSSAMYSGFTQAQLASLSNPQTAAMYAKFAQMSPQAFMQAQYGAAQEAMLSQMAMASSLGIPMAYMYPQMAMDPTLWSSYIAAQAFAEATATTSASAATSAQSSRQKAAASSTTQSATVTTASSLQQRSSTKVSRPASSSTGAEPPRKLAKTDAGTINAPLSLTKQDQQSSLVKGNIGTSKAVSLSSRSDDRPLELTTKSVPYTTGITSISKQQTSAISKTTSTVASMQRPGVVPGQKIAQPKPKLKLSTTASELYAVRMSSALARMSNSPSPVTHPGIVRGPPPKVQRVTEPAASPMSGSTGGGSNLSHLDLLASAAQTHRMMSTSGKTTQASSGQTTTTVSAPKSFSAKALAKRSPHYRPNRSPASKNTQPKPQFIAAQQAAAAAAAAAIKQYIPKPPAAHTKVPVQKAPASTGLRPTQSTSVQVRARSPAPVADSVSSASTVQQALSMLSAKNIPVDLQKKLAAHFQGISMGTKQPSGMASSVAASQGVRPRAATPSSVKKTSPVQGSSTTQGQAAQHSRLLAQHLTSNNPRLQQPVQRLQPAAQRLQPVAQRPQPSAQRPQPSTQRPQPSTQRPQPSAQRPQPAAQGAPRAGITAGVPPLRSPVQGVQGMKAPLLSGGFGRGKPSHPATLASRIQDDSSSDDCIVISSGRESDSD